MSPVRAIRWCGELLRAIRPPPLLARDAMRSKRDRERRAMATLPRLFRAIRSTS